MFKRRQHLKLFVIPSSLGDLRIQPPDGSISVWKPDGEQHCDGWAIFEDVALTLVEHADVDPDEAQSLAAEALDERG